MDKKAAENKNQIRVVPAINIKQTGSMEPHMKISSLVIVKKRAKKYKTINKYKGKRAKPLNAASPSCLFDVR